MRTGNRRRSFLASIMLLIVLTGELAPKVYADGGLTAEYTIDAETFRQDLEDMMPDAGISCTFSVVKNANQVPESFADEESYERLASEPAVYLWYEDETEDVIDEETGTVTGQNVKKRNFYLGSATAQTTIYLPDDSSGLFADCGDFISIHLAGVDTSKATDMKAMFSGCSSLTDLTVTGFDTSNVTDMSEMFRDCASLSSIDAGGFDTSKVTDMSGMFRGCSALRSLDVSGFNTSNVTKISGMFQGCSQLPTLDVGGFDTSNVTDMREMFDQCAELSSLAMDGFDTSKVTNMSGMFRGLQTITSLDVSSFDTSKVTDMSEMFATGKFVTIYASDQWSTAAVTNGDGMFRSCSRLKGGNGTKFTDANVTNVSYARIDTAEAPGYLTASPKHSVSVSVNSVPGNESIGTARVSASAGGRAVERAEAGTHLVLEAAPAEGFLFVKWRVTKGSAEIGDAANPVTSFTMPDEDVQLQAVFAQKTVALSVADPNFEAVQIDYAQPEAAALRITNTGNIDATVTKVEADSADFVIAQVSDTELTGGGTVKADGGINTSWTIRPKAGLAVGDHTTTVTVTYHAFGETNVSEDALQKATVSVVFTVTEKAPPILQSIITPPDLKVANGTAWETITLPATVGINATETVSAATVTWNAGDIAAAKNSYDQNEVENDQTFEISGTITVPDGIVNTNNIPLSVTIKVIVLGKQRAEAPEASLAQSSTAYTEAQSLRISSATADAPIYYTIKTSTGTDAASMPDDPVAGSGDTKLYSEPLTITGVEGQRVYVIIKAIAQSPDASVYRDSEIQTFIYRFEIPQKYTITVAAEGSGGTATAKIGDGEPAALVRALPGTEVTLTAAAATGYSFESWSATGSDGESSPIITESNKTNATVRVRIPRDDVSVKATFKKLVVELDVKAPVFAEQMVGYSQQPAASVITITNNGNTDAQLTGVTVSDAVYTAENGATETVPVFTIGGSGQWVSQKGGSITSWTIQPKTGLAVGTYRAVITVTYKDIDDPAKTQTKTGDVIFSVVKPKLLTIGTPEAVTDLPYGTALADITLPEQVAITTEDASVTTAPVTWNRTDLDGDYTQYGLEEQTFKINGTIELPAAIDAVGKSLKVQIGVTVDGAPKAEAPTASLASGTSYTENQKVTLTSATQDAEIYYTMTTDGTVPSNPAKNDATGKSKKYDGFAALEGTPGVPVTVTVKAIAVKEHMRSSDVSTFVYVIDLPPVYTVTVQSGEGGTATAAAGEETPSGAATARAGVRVTLEAVPDSKHLFKKWEVTSGSGIVIEDETSAQITVAMPESDVTIRAVFEPKTIVPAMDVPSFGWVQGAYEQPEAGVITIRNTGNTDALVKVSIDSSAFVLGKDAAAGGSALPSDQDTVPAGGANASWSLQPKADLAADEYKTTVTVTYTDIEGAEQTLTKDVLFTVYDASVSILLGITAPSDLTDFENGTELADVKAALPATVSINATGEENSADVSWNLAELEANYHVDVLTEQSFVIRGTAALPTGMINPDNHSLNVELRLTVKAAPQAEAPFASLQADRIYTENQTVSISSNTPDAEIYYTMTTDGSEPITPLKGGAGSVRYQGVIPVDGIHGQSVKTIIKAVAVPPQGVRMRDSDVVTFVYTISLPPLYEMTVTKDGSGTIEAEAPEAEEMTENADGSFTVKAIAGTAVTLRAEPAKLYLFKGWSISGATGGTIADAVSTNTTALMPEGNVTVKAVFEKQRIALDVKPPAFATVQEEYAQPDAKTITITNNGNVDAYISEISLGGADFVMAKTGAQEVPNTVSENGGVNLPADTTVLKVQKTIAAGGSLALWTLQPKAGLGIGEHKATVTVTYADVDGESRTQTAQALFSVSDKTFTITFDANGGSGSMKALTVKKGERVTLPANGFTAPSGKAFREWAIGSAGGTAVKAGDTYTFAENTTLYAVWEDSYTATKKEQASNAIKLNAGLKASTKGSKISVSWGKVKTADGYQIYAAYCGKKFDTKTPAKTIRKGSTTSVSISKIGGKKLNTKKQCKLYVVAYKLVNGKKVPIGQSITAYVAGSANKTYTNVKKVTVKKSRITLKVKKTCKLQPKATLVNPSKKKLPASYGKEFRYASSDKSVATVTAAGKIKAVGKGKCTIYVYARNGYAKKVTVTVK